jgi:hypothetical protein
VPKASLTRSWSFDHGETAIAFAAYTVVSNAIRVRLWGQIGSRADSPIRPPMTLLGRSGALSRVALSVSIAHGVKRGLILWRSSEVNRSTAINATDAISTYILAKDSNRPQLMKQAFAGDCELEMAVKTDAISFPSSAKGLESISQVLVTNFAEQYENVRTFCLSRPNSDYLPHFRCDWLLGMSARQGGAVRVGCGHYSWYFGSDDDGRVKKLVIDIEVMCVLPVEESEPIMQWLAALPYPWCSDIQACESIPAMDALRPIERFLRRMEMNKAAIV